VVAQAAAHRAEAMRISDRWVADGARPDSPAIRAERDELVKGYAHCVQRLTWQIE